MNKLKEILSGHKERVAMVAVIVISIILIFVIGIAVANKSKGNEASYNKDWEPVVDVEEEATTGDEEESSTEEEEETLGLEDVTQDQEFGLIDETVETETTASAEKLKYQIRVNRAANCITIYKKDDNGEYTVPCKAIVCSTGKNVGDTPLGEFTTLKSYQWLLMVDGSYGQYAYRYYGSILFHSVPYFSKNKNDLEYEQFNKLGEPASLGCVRVCVRDAMWLIANCPVGTEVIVYDDAENPGPLGKPEMIKIPEDSPYRGWDPTDPDPENPWLQCSPEIAVKDTVEITAGSATAKTIVTKLGATATDTCGNDATAKIKVSGTVDYKKAGTYTLTLSVKDAIGNTCSKTVKLVVKAAEVTTQSTTKQNTTTATKPNTTTTTTTAASATKPTEKTYPVELKVSTSIISVTAGEYQSVTNVLSKMGLSATDSKGNAIAEVQSKVKVSGTVDLNVPGDYTVSLTITDSYGKTSTAKSVTIYVCEPVTEAPTTDAPEVPSTEPSTEPSTDAEEPGTDVQEPSAGENEEQELNAAEV